MRRRPGSCSPPCSGDCPSPVKLLYDRLAELAVGKRVTTAYEPDGRAYGPAIFRIHYAGHRYQPHVDHAGKHERRLDYAVSRFAHQFAGVLCLQNSRAGGHRAGDRVAQSILHRCLWTPELEPCLQADGFAAYAAANAVEHYQVDLQPGDLYFFNTPPGARGAGAGGHLAAGRAGGVHRLLARRSGGVRLVVTGRGAAPRRTKRLFMALALP